MKLTLTQALLDPVLAGDSAGPRVTYYDDATGERTEVSGVTLANWAAKTANFLRDELALEPGARVCVLLPAHWQTAAVLLGTWWAGAEVLLGADSSADFALAAGNRLGEVSDIDEVVAFSLDAFGKPVADLPIGVTDYASSVRIHGDQFRPSGAGSALAGRSVDDVLDAARESARAHGWATSERVMSTLDWDSPERLIDGLLAVLAANGSLVQVANPDASAQTRRSAIEKVTAVLS